MIKSYLVAAIRHYSREKVYATINVVGLANLVTLPLAYVLLNKLIRTGYAFSPAIDLAGFLLVAVLSILGVGLAILNLVGSAARQNPVRSLRYE